MKWYSLFLKWFLNFDETESEEIIKAKLFLWSFWI